METKQILETACEIKSIAFHFPTDISDVRKFKYFFVS